MFSVAFRSEVCFGQSPRAEERRRGGAVSLDLCAVCSWLTAGLLCLPPPQPAAFSHRFSACLRRVCSALLCSLRCAAKMSSPATFVCALSGVVPSVPVVARTSGLLFERRLIEAALASGGPRCPVTGGPLTAEDLIAVHTGIKPNSAAGAAGGNEVVRPRPPSATSIPGLLSLLQGEWDACMLETFHLKQQVSNGRNTTREHRQAVQHEEARRRGWQRCAGGL